MLDSLPSCFRGGAGHPQPSAAAPTVTTSAYETALGLVALSWSKTLLGLHVVADLRLSIDDSDEDTGDLSFKIRPWLLFTRRGSKQFLRHNHHIDFAWDFTRARFPDGGSTEPVDGFFLSVAVDGEIILVAGDLTDLAFKRMKLKKRAVNSSLISRREQVTMREDRIYKTQARFGGKERSISIDLNGEMSLEVDGKQILQIRRLRWKFRGSEKVQLEGGDQIQLSWDLHNWLFPSKDAGASGDRNSTGNALFVFRFESETLAEQSHYGYLGNLGGQFGKNKNWSDSSGEHNSGRKKRLSKTSSTSSSSSSASSAASSSVMEWASPEENELKGKLGFSLLISAWKS